MFHGRYFSGNHSSFGFALASDTPYTDSYDFCITGAIVNDGDGG